MALDDDHTQPPGPVAYSLSFDEAFKANNSFLISFPPKILEKIRRSPASVHITGGSDDKAVLCTEDETYELVSAETSNALYLASVTHQPPAAASILITESFGFYIDVERIQPSLAAADRLLASATIERAFLQNLDAFIEHRGCRFTDLVRHARASTAEIESHLAALNAVYIRQKWFLLSEEARIALVDLLLREIIASGHTIDHVVFGSHLKACNLPRDLLIYLCEYLSAGAKQKKNRTTCFRFSHDLLVHHTGLALLYQQPVWETLDLLQAWQHSLDRIGPIEAPNAITSTSTLASRLVLTNKLEIPDAARQYLQHNSFATSDPNAPCVVFFEQYLALSLSSASEDDAKTESDRHAQLDAAIPLLLRLRASWPLIDLFHALSIWLRKKTRPSEASFTLPYLESLLARKYKLHLTNAQKHVSFQ